MDTKDKDNEPDLLKTLFSRMEEEPLPASFCEEVMRRVEAESARVRRRNERLGLLCVVVASLGIIGLAVATFMRVGVTLPQWELRLPESSALPFYLYIGAIAFMLLTIDYFFRQAYRKRRR
jgi:hypothetical protein